MSECDSYADLVEKALHQWQETDRSQSVHYLPLFNMLGCDHVSFIGSNWVLWEAPKVTASNEHVVGPALLQIVKGYTRVMGAAGWVERAVLHRLLDHGHWRACMATEGDARVFTDLIAKVFNPYRELHMGPGDIQLRDRAMLKLQIDIQAWIPQNQCGEEFGERSFASAFFGDAWCSIIYDSRGAGVSLVDLLNQERPQFVPGRLSSDLESEVATLPSLEGYS